MGTSLKTHCSGKVVTWISLLCSLEHDACSSEHNNHALQRTCVPHVPQQGHRCRVLTKPLKLSSSRPLVWAVSSRSLHASPAAPASGLCISIIAHTHPTFSRPANAQSHTRKSLTERTDTRGGEREETDGPNTCSVLHSDSCFWIMTQTDGRFMQPKAHKTSFMCAQPLGDM